MKKKSNRFLVFAAITTALLLTSSCASLGKANSPKRILVVTITKGFRHSSIPVAEKTLKELSQRTGAFTVDIAGVDPDSAQFKGSDGNPDTNKIHQAIAKV